MAEDMKIEDLARIVQGEFQNIRTEFQGEFQNIRTEFQGEFQNIRTDIHEIKEKLDELDTKVARIDLRTQHQVDAVYEDTAVLKKGMKVAQADIVVLKTHAGLKV